MAETIALEEMDHGLGIEHVLVSESDSKARALILENFPINVRIEKDILARDVSSAAACDIYFCGFPCQPFSLMGKNKASSISRDGASSRMLASRTSSPNCPKRSCSRTSKVSSPSGTANCGNMFCESFGEQIWVGTPHTK